MRIAEKMRKLWQETPESVIFPSSDISLADAAVVHQTMTDDARKWVRGLDRERIGTLAVDEDVLIAIHIHRSLLIHYRNLGGGGMLGEVAKYAVDKALERVGQSTSSKYIINARLEAFFWWSLGYGGRELKKWAIGTLESDRDFNVLSPQIALMYKYPEYHPYFDVGVWDVKLIRNCVSSGIDPDLALSLS